MEKINAETTTFCSPKTYSLPPLFYSLLCFSQFSEVPWVINLLNFQQRSVSDQMLAELIVLILSRSLFLTQHLTVHLKSLSLSLCTLWVTR